MVRMRPNEDSLSAHGVEMLADDANGAGRFSMLAYTGDVVERYWGRLVIDLDGLDCGNGKRPILYGHSERVAFSESIKRTPRGLEISGKFLDNALAAEIRKDSRAGFPWQASVGVAFSEMQDVDEKTKATVNGRTFMGPLTIARKSKLLESSFVECGADNKTSAEALKRAEAHRMDGAEMKAAEPAAVDVAAVKAGEAARLAAIKAALPGRLELAVERFAAGDTPEQAKVLGEVLAREDAKRPVQKAAQVVPFAACESAAAPATADLSIEDRAAADWSKKSVRDEFLSKEDYIAFLAAQERGSVRMCAPALSAK